MELLKNFDLFGKSVKFRVLEREKFHSSISITFSLIIILLSTIFSYFFGLDFIFHSESKVIQSTRTSKTYKFINLTMDDLFIAWRIEGLYGEEINYTNVLFPYLSYYTHKTEEIIKIKHEKCNKFKLPKNTPKDISNYYCNDISNYSIGGGWENDNKIEYLTLNVDICNDTICPSKLEFTDLLNRYGGVYLVIYYPTINFLPEEDIPYQIFYNKINVFLNMELITVNRLYIHKYIFEDDIGWFLPKIKSNELFGINKIETYNILNNLGNNVPLNSYIYAANLYFDRNYSYHKRWFTKAFESLSIITAFSKVFYFIFKWFSSICNEYLLYEIIMNNNNITEMTVKQNKLRTHKNFNSILNPISNNINNNNELCNSNLQIINDINKNNNKINKFDSNKKLEVSNIENNKITEYIFPKNKIENRKAYRLNVSYFRSLFFYLFHCILSKKIKSSYYKNMMERNSLFKKLNISKYINLVYRFDFLDGKIKQGKQKEFSDAIYVHNEREKII